MGFTIAELADYETKAKEPPKVETPPASAEPAAESPPAEAVVEPVVESEATSEAPAAEAETPSASEAAPPAEPPKKGGARERIEELVAERNALKQYNEYLQNDVLTKLKPAEAPKPAPAEDSAPPTLASAGFDTDKWAQAMHAWTQKQIEANVQKAITVTKQQDREAQAREAFEIRMADYVSKNPHIPVALANPNLPMLSKDAARLVVASELGPQIIGHLATNVEKAARIARLDPIAQAAAIGRLEVELTKPAPIKTATKTTTKAPTPPTQTPGGGPTNAEGINQTTAQMMAELRQKRGRVR